MRDACARGRVLVSLWGIIIIDEMTSRVGERRNHGAGTLSSASDQAEAMCERTRAEDACIYIYIYTYIADIYGARSDS